jgi:hypothetical protein
MMQSQSYNNFATISAPKRNWKPAMSELTAFEPSDSAAAEALVDLDCWPIHQPSSFFYKSAIVRIRAELATDGCARIAGFIRPSVQRQLEEEVAAIASLAHFSNCRITPYFNDDEPELPADHPRRRFADFSNGFVAMDRFPPRGIVLSLYHDVVFQHFVQDCLQEPALYTFDDPLAGVVANIVPERASLPWHFDTNEFIVSLLTRKSTAGGAFEYCPDLRRLGDECYPQVQAVLDGDRSRVRTVDLEIGDLQLFRGRFSMHRVCAGKGERHTVILGYARQPGFVGRLARTQQVHGRVTQTHIDAEAEIRTDGLDD